MPQIEITAQAGVSLEAEGRKVLSVPQEAGGKSCPEERGKRANLFVCLRGNERQQKHPATPHRHMGARLPHTHMLNDSIYSPRHYIFIFASLFSLMVLPICTSSFPSLLVYSSYGRSVNNLPSFACGWRHIRQNCGL